MTKETMNHLSIIDQIVPVITGMWAVVNKPGSRNRLHSHPYNNMSITEMKTESLIRLL